MSDRWAVILKETGEVIDVKLMDGVAPEINADKAHLYDVLKVGAGPQIGMVRGGPQSAADGWGYPAGVDIANRISNLPKPPLYTDADPAPSNHEKKRAGDEGKPSLTGASPMPESSPALRKRQLRTDAAQKAARDKAETERLAMSGAGTRAMR